jgi:hypothetical protein
MCHMAACRGHHDDHGPRAMRMGHGRSSAAVQGARPVSSQQAASHRRPASQPAQEVAHCLRYAYVGSPHLTVGSSGTAAMSGGKGRARPQAAAAQGRSLQRSRGSSRSGAAAAGGAPGRRRARPPPAAARAARRALAGFGVVCLRTALFTEVGFYEACNNKVR